MSLLSTIERGRKVKPLALMLHGVHGVGKTSFALDAPNPIYMGNEESDEYDMARFPKILVWSQLLEQLATLRDEPHDFKTLVIDTTDSLETIAQAEILTGKEKSKTMETAYGGYGKAYRKMADMFLNIREEYLVPIRDKRGMNIILLAHSTKVKHEDPMTNTAYDQYIPANDKRVRPIFEEWVSTILFVNYYLVRAETGAGKEYVQGADGARMIYTEERPSHIAKNRFDLPFEIDYDKHGAWKKIRTLIMEHYAKGPKKETVVENKMMEAAKNNMMEVPKELAPVTIPPLAATPPAVESQDVIALGKEIDELMSKIPESSVNGIVTSVKRAGNNADELKRIVQKMHKIIN